MTEPLILAPVRLEKQNLVRHKKRNHTEKAASFLDLIKIKMAGFLAFNWFPHV